MASTFILAFSSLPDADGTYYHVPGEENKPWVARPRRGTGPLIGNMHILIKNLDKVRVNP
jgi:hypothetical protein